MFSIFCLTLSESGLTIVHKVENHVDLKQLINNEKIKILTYNKPMDLISFSSNKSSPLLRLLTIGSKYDDRQLILERPDAVNWEKDLFGIT